MAKYDADQMKTMMSKGQAMPNASGQPSFPIMDREDLTNAIRAVGRAGRSGNAVRRHIMKRARALGLTDMIPDTWNADGSLGSRSERGGVSATEEEPMDAPRFPVGTVESRMSRSDLETDGRTLAGYLAVFNSPAVIQEQRGEFLERIKPGAFKKTIREGAPERVKVMFDHGIHDHKLPIGKMQTLREDTTGLYFEARLSDIAFNNETLIPLIQDGAIDGTSFRGVFTKDEWRSPTARGPRERDVYEVALVEGGPVTWPAYQATSIGLRSIDGGLIFETSVWDSLTDAQRDEIAGIIRSATDLRTLEPEAGHDHFGDGAATSATEPHGVEHSDSNPISRRQAAAAVARLRSLIDA